MHFKNTLNLTPIVLLYYKLYLKYFYFIILSKNYINIPHNLSIINYSLSFVARAPALAAAKGRVFFGGLFLELEIFRLEFSEVYLIRIFNLGFLYGFMGLYLICLFFLLANLESEVVKRQ